MDKYPEGLQGLDTASFSNANYPSCVFLLERAGTFSYERFAYNSLRIGVEALNAKGFTDQISVDFSLGLDRQQPWTLNAEIATIGDSEGQDGYRIRTSPFTPLVLHGISYQVGNKLLDLEILVQWLSEPDKFSEEIRSIAQMIQRAVKGYRNNSLGESLNTLIEGFELNLENIYKSVDDFDVTVKFIVMHEVAHAYVNQFEYMSEGIPKQDFRAFEYVADLVATSWLYSGIIVNTPDSEGYRKTRGFWSHEESIRENTIWVLRSQLIVLIFLALASAIREKGKVSMEGGMLHPHTYLRYMMQQNHFMTLVLSNYKGSFNSEQIETVDKLWQEALKLFTITGLVPTDELNAIFDDDKFSDIRRAGVIAEKLDIPELRGAHKFLEQLKAFRPNSTADLETQNFTEQSGTEYY